MLACLPIEPSLCLPTPVAVRSYQCPKELPQLSALLVRDIIPYANRAAQRRRKKIQPHNQLDPNYSSFLSVGNSSMEPLNFENPEYQPRHAAPPQLFLTSLEKQHRAGSSSAIQRFYWIFLDRGKTGWNINAIYSRVGNSSPQSPPLVLPPTDGRSTPFGEAIANWLRDCNFGRIPP